MRPAKDDGNLLAAAAIVCKARPDVRFAIVRDVRGRINARRMCDAYQRLNEQMIITA